MYDIDIIYNNIYIYIYYNYVIYTINIRCQFSGNARLFSHLFPRAHLASQIGPYHKNDTGEFERNPPLIVWLVVQ